MCGFALGGWQAEQTTLHLDHPPAPELGMPWKPQAGEARFPFSSLGKTKWPLAELLQCSSTNGCLAIVQSQALCLPQTGKRGELGWPLPCPESVEMDVQPQKIKLVPPLFSAWKEKQPECVVKMPYLEVGFNGTDFQEMCFGSGTGLQA